MALHGGGLDSMIRWSNFSNKSIMLRVSFGLHQHISHGRARSDKSLKKHEKSLRPWLTIMWWQVAFPCLFFRLEHHRGFPSRVRKGRGTGNIYSSAAGAHQRLLISIGGWATITSPRTVSGTQPGSDVVLEDVNCANVANSFFVMIRATTSSSHRFHVALSCDFVSYLRSFGIELRFASVCLLTVFFASSADFYNKRFTSHFFLVSFFCENENLNEAWVEPSKFHPTIETRAVFTVKIV